MKKNVSNIKMQDISTWKPIQNREGPKQHHPQYANIQHLRDHGQKARRKRLIYLQDFSEIFSPPNNVQDQKVEQDLATPIQSQERLRTFTLKELHDEIETLNQEKGTRSRHYYCQNAKRTTKRRTLNLMYILNAILRLE